MMDAEAQEPIYSLWNQKHARLFRRHLAGLLARPVWNALGVHREAEFNRSHVPAFVRGIAPGAWLAVYPDEHGLGVRARRLRMDASAGDG